MHSTGEDPDSLHSKAIGKDAAVSIRTISIDDLPHIFHLGEKLFTARKVPNLHRTWDEYEVVSLFQGDDEYCFVAENEASELVGFALGTMIQKSHSWKYGYLLWLGVHPYYQQSGVARRLFRHFRSVMIEDGARIIMVDTEADNDAALRFFRKVGFNHARNHVFLSMNVDEERRRLEIKRQERESAGFREGRRTMRKP
ncbi:MAG: GNAT family N-acetyltransferase [Desulfobacterales bacterium]